MAKHTLNQINQLTPRNEILSNTTRFHLGGVLGSLSLRGLIPVFNTVFLVAHLLKTSCPIKIKACKNVTTEDIIKAVTNCCRINLVFANHLSSNLLNALQPDQMQSKNSLKSN